MPYRIKSYGLCAELGAVKASRGRVINLYTADRSPDFRLKISGDYYMGPEDHTVSWPHGVDRPSITVNLRREATIIAKEINSRFLPGHDVACTKIAELVKQDADYRNGLRSTTDRLAAIAGVKVREVPHSSPVELQTEFFKYYGPSSCRGPRLEVKASSDGARIEFDCGVELAAAIVKAIEALATKTNPQDYGIVQTVQTVFKGPYVADPPGSIVWTDELQRQVFKNEDED